MDTKQHLYLCTNPECPVVVFIDRMMGDADPATQGMCPDDCHDFTDPKDRGLLIEKTF